VEFLPAIEPGLDRRHIMAELQHRIEQTTALLVAESNGMENIPRAIPATSEAH
jgi:hypothetical protein